MKKNMKRRTLRMRISELLTNFVDAGIPPERPPEGNPDGGWRMPIAGEALPYIYDNKPKPRDPRD